VHLIIIHNYSSSLNKGNHTHDGVWIFLILIIIGIDLIITFNCFLLSFIPTKKIYWILMTAYLATFHNTLKFVNFFYDYFAEMQNRSLVSERKFTRLVGLSVDPWVVNFCLHFRWPMHNLTWRSERCRQKRRQMVRQMWNIVK